MTEEARCTCLDRARIALEQTGQHHCAGVMKELQDHFDAFCSDALIDPNDPVLALQSMMDCWLEVGIYRTRVMVEHQEDRGQYRIIINIPDDIDRHG
jgi:hypothetical protein